MPISKKYIPVFITMCFVVLIALAPFGETADPEPVYGGSMVLALEGEPSSITAMLATDTAALCVATNIFNGLVSKDLEFNIQPDLAKEWSMSPDGLEYTFYLHENARWHDGVPVTAEDVVFTFDLTREIHPRAGAWMDVIEDVVATDEHTVVVKLSEPYAPLLVVIGNPLVSGIAIVPKHIFDVDDVREIATDPSKVIGSGAFKVDEYVPGSHVRLVRNDDYFKEGLPYLDELIFRFMPDASARLMGLEAGEVDFLHYYVVPYEELTRLKADPDINVLEYGGESPATSGYLLFNTRHEAMGNKEVRQAIAYALDREIISDMAYFGNALVARSFLHSAQPQFTSEYDVYTRDVDMANAMLDEAGFPRGADDVRFELSLTWDVGREFEGRSAEVIIDQLRAVGIDLVLEPMDRASYIDRVYMNWDFDLALQLYTNGPDPAISVTPRWHTRQIREAAFTNAPGYSNPELDELFDTEYVTIDPAERTAKLHRIQEILMEDLPGLPIYEVPNVNIASARIGSPIITSFGYIESRENAFRADLAEAAAPSDDSDQPVAPDDDEAAAANNWLWIVIGAVVVIGVVIFMRKKKSE